jgi:hypothetical protein
MPLADRVGRGPIQGCVAGGTFDLDFADVASATRPRSDRRQLSRFDQVDEHVPFRGLENGEVAFLTDSHFVADDLHLGTGGTPGTGTSSSASPSFLTSLCDFEPLKFSM